MNNSLTLYNAIIIGRVCKQLVLLVINVCPIDIYFNTSNYIEIVIQYFDVLFKLC